MEKGFTITYEYGDNLYVNPTNRCNFNCEFCLRAKSCCACQVDNPGSFMHPGQTGTGHFGQSPAVQVDHAELKFPVFLCNLLYCPGLSESGCIDQHTDIRILILQITEKLT